MGNLQSIPSRIERRRANRLSKSFTNKACLSPIDTRSPPTNSQVNSLPASPRNSTWEDPWDDYPASASVDGRFPQSLPSTRAQARPPIPRAFWSAQSDSIAEENYQYGGSYDFPSSVPTTPVIGKPSSLRTFRRASYHPDTTLYSPSLSSPSPRQHIRSYSLQFTPQSTNDTIYENEFEDATSSNTYFMVDSQRFSITRRRSLLTRPGMATRRLSKQSVRRLSPPTVGGHDVRSSNGTYEKSKSMQLPLPDIEGCDNEKHSRPAACTRPDTPSDFQYTHLGALKLGSLRVVNRSASPSPSDHSNMSRESSEDSHPMISASSDHPEDATRREPSLLCPPDQATGDKVSQKTTSESTSVQLSKSLPRLCPTSNSEEQADDPISPFSFQKSPTVTTVPPYATLSAQNIEKANEENLAESNGSGERKLAKSLSKTDSGYSSATSTHSSRKLARASIDSQRLDQHSWGSCEVSGSDHEQQHKRGFSWASTQVPLQRHLSLQDPKNSGYTPCLDNKSRLSSGHGPSRSFSLKASVGLGRTSSSVRPSIPWDGNDFDASNSDTRVSRPSANSWGMRPSSLRVLHQKSVSTPNTGEPRRSLARGMSSPQSQRQLDADAPCHDSFAYRRLQAQNTRRSVAEAKTHQHIGIDMSTEKFLLSRDELSIAAWLEQPSVQG